MLFWNVNFAWLFFGFLHVSKFWVCPVSPFPHSIITTPKDKKNSSHNHGRGKWDLSNPWILDSSHLGRIFHINHFFWGEMPKKIETSLQFFQQKKSKTKVHIQSNPKIFEPWWGEKFLNKKNPSNPRSHQKNGPTPSVPSHHQNTMLLGALVRSKSKGSDEQQVLRAALVCVSSGPGP